jgi:uncharacterized protein (DUF1684 family)
MKKLFCIFLASGIITNAYCQSFKQKTLAYREHYKKEFPATDTAFVRFYAPDEKYAVVADFSPSPQSVPFQIPTHSGKTKTCKEYGILTFKLNKKKYVLHVYQLPDLIKRDSSYRNELFIPFTDETNYKETYGGGRYIDLQIPDIKNNKIVIDFNRCYNPSCAYASGFSCPIPPKENDLKTPVRAGEKLFGRKVSE